MLRAAHTLRVCTAGIGAKTVPMHAQSQRGKQAIPNLGGRARPIPIQHAALGQKGRQHQMGAANTAHLEPSTTINYVTKQRCAGMASRNGGQAVYGTHAKQRHRVMRKWCAASAQAMFGASGAAWPCSRQVCGHRCRYTYLPIYVPATQAGNAHERVGPTAHRRASSAIHHSRTQRLLYPDLLRVAALAQPQWADAPKSTAGAWEPVQERGRGASSCRAAGPGTTNQPMDPSAGASARSQPAPWRLQSLPTGEARFAPRAR